MEHPVYEGCVSKLIRFNNKLNVKRIFYFSRRIDFLISLGHRKSYLSATLRFCQHLFWFVNVYFLIWKLKKLHGLDPENMVDEVANRNVILPIAVGSEAAL